MTKLIWPLLGGTLWLTGCSCTRMACEDELDVTVKASAAATFPDGTHELVIAPEGAPVITCTFELPRAGTRAQVTCLPAGRGISLSFEPVESCTSEVVGDAPRQTCTPVPGRFVQRFSVPGTAGRIRITQRTLSGGALFDHQVTPRYETRYPNGESCDGECRQGAVELTF